MLRFAPSPTGDMHIEDLRVAIFNYIVAKQRDVNFIVRIEDTDKEKVITGKDTEIMDILEKFALPHDRVSHQSENLHIHQTLAIRLLEEKKAFVCTCTPDDETYNGHCTSMGAEELKKLKEQKTPFVLRVKKPDAPVITHDLLQGDIQTGPDEVDSFVILKEDSTPTYDFACACDDMISGITFIIRSEEHLSSSPKQTHIKTLLGYGEKTEYLHLPIMLNADGKKMDMHHETSSIKWLFEQGFIPDAIANYLIALGNETPTEFFTMPDALEWFDVNKLSHAPVRFDLDALRSLNRQHLKEMDDKRLSGLFGFADEDIGKLAKLYLEEANTINELVAKVKPIFSPKDFDAQWGDEMRVMAEYIETMPMIDDFTDFYDDIERKTGLKDENLHTPLRLLLTGAEDGPELSKIYPLIKPYLLEVIS